MAAASKDFTELFDALRKVLKPLESELVVKVDRADRYYLDAPTLDSTGQPLFFGAVRTGTRNVSVHLMPIHLSPELLRGASPELLRHLQGTSCFNFTRPEYALFRELATLARAGLEDYRRAGRLG